MNQSAGDSGDSDRLPPDEAFALLGNETRVDILRALWDAFESGKGDNAVPFSELYEAVDIGDSGNFSYHLEKLTGPFVRRTDDGYALKQSGINVVRAVTVGSVTADPRFGPTSIDVDCPCCEAPVEVAYADELMTVSCTECAGMRRWNDEPGFLFASLAPPAVVDGRTVEEAFRAATVYALHQVAALHAGVCPHCASRPETAVDVCADHRPASDALCPGCGWAHVAEVWWVCTACKRSMFPPVRTVILDDPDVTAFYRDHGVRHRFASWESIVRSFDVGEELLSEDPLEMRFTIPAGGDELRLTVDEELNVVDVSS